jgi:ribonuclease Z
MKITLLGTGSPIPNPDRAGPSTLVQSEAANTLFDCGRGVVMRLAEAKLLPIMLNAVVLTHLHSDHVCDLNDVITTHWVMSANPTPLRIIGPVGTQRFVDAVLVSLETDNGYRLAHHDDLNEGPLLHVEEVEPGDTFTIGDQEVVVGATDHRPVEPTLGYRVTWHEQSVVVAGDGVPCASLDDLVHGATAYVQTVIRDDLVELIPVPRLQDILDYHSSVAQAADTAQRAGVKALVLTHYVPAPAPGTEDEWKSFASVFNGLVVMGDDLTSLDLDSFYPEP